MLFLVPFAQVLIQVPFARVLILFFFSTICTSVDTSTICTSVDTGRSVYIKTHQYNYIMTINTGLRILKRLQNPQNICGQVSLFENVVVVATRGFGWKLSSLLELFAFHFF